MTTRGQNPFPMLACLLAACLLIGGIAWFAVNQDDSKQQRAEFAGACKVLEGEVHDDLCVKGDTVVLTRAEFEKE